MQPSHQDPALRIARRLIAEQRGWTDFYHVSPRANRESIQNMGLMGENGTSPWGDPFKRGQPHGNYFFDNHQDAQNYAWSLKQRNPQGSDEEDRWNWPEPPEGFDDWEPDAQDDWHDNNEPTPATEDPNGYDVWKVNTRNLPIHRDPESAITTDKPFTPQTLNEEYSYRGNPMAGDVDPWADKLQDHAQLHGTVPRRFYTPEAVEPQRMQLQQHMPSWDMGENDYYDRIDDPEMTERESPLSWDEMNLRRPQFPAHSRTEWDESVL
jgi:hypothetical protein